MYSEIHMNVFYVKLLSNVYKIHESLPRPGGFTPGKRPGTHCKEGGVDPMVGLNGCEICRTRRDSMPVPSSS